MQNFDIKNIRHPKEVKDMFSKLVDASRLRNRVYTSESVASQPHHVEGHEPPPPPPEIDRTDDNGNGIPDVFEK